jgi:four helix bundle protein
MPHNPSRLLVVARAEALTVAVHGYAARNARRLGDLSPGLRNQLLCAAVSISLNLAEACGYHTAAKSASFLEIAIGSCNEVERILALCHRLGVHDPDTGALVADIGSVRALLYGFRRHLRKCQ